VCIHWGWYWAGGCSRTKVALFNSIFNSILPLEYAILCYITQSNFDLSIRIDPNGKPNYFGRLKIDLNQVCVCLCPHDMMWLFQDWVGPKSVLVCVLRHDMMDFVALNKNSSDVEWVSSYKDPTHAQIPQMQKSMQLRTIQQNPKTHIHVYKLTNK
jgi:hypothetical protein